jgi:hypothetical protein
LIEILQYSSCSLPPLASSYSLPQLFCALPLAFFNFNIRRPLSTPPPPLRVNNVMVVARSLPRSPSPIRPCYAAATPRYPAEHVCSLESASPNLFSHLPHPVLHLCFSIGSLSVSAQFLRSLPPRFAPYQPCPHLYAHDHKTDATSVRCGSASCNDDKVRFSWLGEEFA